MKHFQPIPKVQVTGILCAIFTPFIQLYRSCSNSNGSLLGILMTSALIIDADIMMHLQQNSYHRSYPALITNITPTPNYINLLLKVLLSCLGARHTLTILYNYNMNEPTNLNNGQTKKGATWKFIEEMNFLGQVQR